MEREEIDFMQNPPEVREWLLVNTWCESCQEPDLGMRNPRQYQQGERMYVEGVCVRCGERVTSEILEDR